MSDNFTDWQKYVISKLDDIKGDIAKLEVNTNKNLVKSHSKLDAKINTLVASLDEKNNKAHAGIDEKITNVRLKLSGIMVVTAIVTSVITSTIVTNVKQVLKQPALIEHNRKE